MRFRPFFIGVLCSGPVAAFVLLAAYVVTAYTALGYWPRPNLPDPKELGFGVFHAITILAFFWAGLSATVVSIFAVVRYRQLWKEHKSGFVIWAIGILLLVLLAIPQNGRFVSWLLD